MYMITFFILFSSFMFIMFSNSMFMILSILVMTIFGSFLCMQMVNIHWIIYMGMFIMVGGLMIIYVFVLCLNTNESFVSKSKFTFFSCLILCIIVNNALFYANESKNMSKCVYENFVFLILSILLLLIIVMFFSSKLIMNPNTPSKSMK